ncbi:protein-(glutamine-N5) methyltransferase, release factor-specific [Paenibacillus selenitireducens]|uniref:Release factor glutamine methyltransferase n=1 Tax=Paenibacillus selenitireducens TaxID=1324314 RepID=A0A1T2X782_9BACL|nr:peptide chain release factor N(5)-glutamine methyltransferase [Paenibacillus selenitireducens]OPA75737.1 protein-(glutamine-N5) methyltransferase, release factor-specific [Paenibacillus selenitireducens]
MNKTLREAYVEASLFLSQHQVMEPEHNAELLLCHVLRLSRASFLMRMPEPFPAEHEVEWQAVLARKASGEPAQYIIGEQEFYGLPFEVTPDVLIPRPETELLVEAVVKEGRRLWPDGAPTAADIGTGSGAIAVTLASQCPTWRIAASDISPAALAVAQRNAARNSVAARIAWHSGDLLAPLAGQGLDILVSNPPYIPASVIAGLQSEVRDYEPRTALDGGTDGLDPYRRMLAQLPLLAAPPRVVGFELGQGQAREVAAWMEAAGHWDTVYIVSDLAGIERHVMAVRE